MSTKTLRLIGFVFLVCAVVAGILNLRRVANAGIGWLPPILVVLGIVFLINAKRRA